MLQALIHRKLDRWLGDHPPEEIEDLLTSVVLGSASYAPDLALLPFLCDAVSLVGERLASKLDGLQVRSVQFWPQLAGGSVPDVLVELCDTGGHRQLLVVEVKLGAGKSSDPSDSGPVTDQLGKYWLSLRHEAVQRTQSSALAVVYLTANIGMPRGDLEATQHELRTKAEPEAPLYWLSWRRFGEVVRHDESPMLRDCVQLLRERYGLVHIVMKPLGAPPILPDPWRYRGGWRWPMPPRVHTAWRFAPGDRA
jgi:hypothetical protein